MSGHGPDRGQDHSRVSTHVLDSSRGRPAVGVRVSLERAGEPLAKTYTDDDGRVRDLVPAGLAAGTYRLVFDTGAYFAAAGQRGFYPEVAITFEITEEHRHYHVPLLLSPFAYSTYRGS